MPSNIAYEQPQSLFSLYSATRGFIRFCTHVFFKDITPIGVDNIPKSGPVIFCGNHQNQYMDGCILMTEASRDVRFLVAGTSYRAPVLNHFFKAYKSIPVERAIDHAKDGSGVVKFEDEFTVIGVGTKFTTEFKVGDSINIPKVQDQKKIEDQIVESIESDLKIILKKPGVQLDDNQKGCEMKYRILQRFDQSEVFNRVHDELGKGGSIAIFPEGGSHDNTDFLPFKAGIAMMALGTIVKTGQIPVIIPSGLKYFKRHEFRSRVIIEFGRPFRPTNKMVELYKTGDKRKAITLFLKEIENRMREVTITAPTYHELQAIYMARNIYMPEDPKILNQMTEQ